MSYTLALRNRAAPARRFDPFFTNGLVIGLLLGAAGEALISFGYDLFQFVGKTVADAISWLEWQLADVDQRIAMLEAQDAALAADISAQWSDHRSQIADLKAQRDALAASIANLAAQPRDAVITA